MFAAWVAYPNLVRRAVMALASPQTFSLALTRRGSPVASPEAAVGDLVVVTGTLPGVVTSDGPRNGAVWGLAVHLGGEGGRGSSTR